MRNCSIILLLCFVFSLSAQTREQNLEKYWNYRDRLRTQFVMVTDRVLDCGVNIPASDLYINESSISWGDANNNISHYLSALSTELYLLKSNKQDYHTTMQELVFALFAIERLDAYTESVFRWKIENGFWLENSSISKAYAEDSDINGFMLRDDIGDDFWEHYSSHFTVKSCCGHLNRKDEFLLEEMSQDVIEHIIEGLNLVNSLCSEELNTSIHVNLDNQHIRNYLTHKRIISFEKNDSSTIQTVNFSLWAKDIVKRFILYMQHKNAYQLKTSLPFFNKKITIHSTHWVLMNPILKIPVMQGNGLDGGVAMISNGLIKTAEAITGENLRKYPGLFSGSMYKLAVRYPRIFQLGLEDNKTRLLACNGNVLGKKTFRVLRKLRDTYNPHKTKHFPIYEHFPLMYLAINHNDYYHQNLDSASIQNDLKLYERLLNLAPKNGPSTECGVYEWSSTSRCLWPENLGKNKGKNIEYNGLDYIMLHNLYYIAFNINGFRRIR